MDNRVIIATIDSIIEVSKDKTSINILKYMRHWISIQKGDFNRVARRVKVNRSTVLRSLRRLELLGLVIYDPQFRCYELAESYLHIGRCYTSGKL